MLAINWSYEFDHMHATQEGTGELLLRLSDKTNKNKRLSDKTNKNNKISKTKHAKLKKQFLFFPSVKIFNK